MYTNKAYGVQRDNIDELYKIIDTGVDNSYLVFGSVLIDVGVPFKKVAPYVKDIEFILLTHRHTDHIRPSTLGRILRMRPKVIMYIGPWLVPTIEKMEEKEEIPKNRYKVIHPGYDYAQGRFEFLPIQVLHNVPNVGYFIHDGKTGLTVFHATDLSSHEGFSAMGADIVALEFNHISSMMEELIKADLMSQGFSHYAESQHYHFSFEKARDFVDTKTKGEEYITLFKLHTSEYFKKFLEGA